MTAKIIVSAEKQLSEQNKKQDTEIQKIHEFDDSFSTSPPSPQWYLSGTDFAEGLFLLKGSSSVCRPVVLTGDHLIIR